MSERNEEVWLEICLQLRKRVNEDTYERWFSEVRLLQDTGKELALEVPNHIYQVWIEMNYAETLQEAVLAVLGEPRSVVFRWPAEAPAGRRETGAPEEAARTPAQPEAGGRPGRGRSGGAASGSREGLLEAGLNPRHTFDSFVVGANTQFAAAAARAVAEQPGKIYNPLFIFGASGLGKTHLMQAIGHEVMRAHPRRKVAYVTSERFTNEFIEALQKGGLPQFRRRYRTVDVLLIDDVQFLAGKERSQEEFYHTFNVLSDGHKQIVMTCDKPASAVAEMEKRLISRCEWGLTAELVPPDTETRIAILRKRMEDWRVDLDPDLILYLAERIQTNIRRLEGGLMRVASYASLGRGAGGGRIEVSEIEPILRDLLTDENGERITLEEVQKAVAAHYDLRVSDLVGRRRTARVALARQVAMYLCREEVRAPFAEIAETFGGRDHGTVIYACRMIENRMVANAGLRQDLASLRGRLRN